MGQKYEGTLIIQTTNDYSPVGSQTLAALENSAFSDDILSGKSLYSQNGQLLKGSFVDGWPIEIGTEEEMDAFATLDNVERYVKYVENNASVQPEPIVVGDTITQLYFNTSVVPDFSLLDWSNAEDVEGLATLALINSEGLTAGQAPLRIVRADNTVIPTLQGTMYQLQNSVADGTNLYIQCAPEDVAFCEKNGITPNQWIIENNPFPFDADVVVSAVNQQDIWGAYVAKEPFNAVTAKASGAPVPVNPIADGDIIEAVYFNTSVTPNLSAFDFNNPDSEMSGGGSVVRRINFFQVSLGGDSLNVQIAAMYPDGLEGDVIYMIGAGDWSSYMYSESTKYKPSSYGLEQWGWTSSTLLEGIGQFTVSNVKNQDIWGSYVSKDGLWSNGSKYTSGQVYKVVQNGDIVELKEIQY